MTPLKFIIAFLLTGLYSCGQIASKYKPAPEAVKLNNLAMNLVPSYKNADSAKKAIYFLDKATSIDSNYFIAYFNKLMFYNQLKQQDKAISTVNKMIQLRPEAHDLYLTGGVLYEKTGDTASARIFFKKSLVICNVVLDTMSRNNQDFFSLTINQAMNLIMLNDSVRANEILKNLYNNLPENKESGNIEKDYVLSLIGKSKNDLLKESDEASTAEVNSTR